MCIRDRSGILFSASMCGYVLNRKEKYKSAKLVFLIILSGIMFPYQTVSYTHLDVYKRQVCKGLDEMKKEYEKIREMMDYQFFISESSYILYDSDFIIKKQSDMLPVYFNKILTCGKLKDYAGIRTEFKKVFQYIDDNMGFSSIYIKYNFTDIMKKLCECLHNEEWLVQGLSLIHIYTIQLICRW